MSICLLSMAVSAGHCGQQMGGGQQVWDNKMSWKMYAEEKKASAVHCFPTFYSPAVKGDHQLSGCLGLSKPLIKPAKIFKKSFLQIFSSFTLLSVLKGSLGICKGRRSPSPATVLPHSVIKNTAPPNSSFHASPVGSGRCGQQFRSILLACPPCKNRSPMGDAGSS